MQFCLTTIASWLVSWLNVLRVLAALLIMLSDVYVNYVHSNISRMCYESLIKKNAFVLYIMYHLFDRN